MFQNNIQVELSELSALYSSVLVTFHYSTIFGEMKMIINHIKTSAITNTI